MNLQKRIFKKKIAANTDEYAQLSCYKIKNYLSVRTTGL